jgi:molecular chaperone GrpE (heat shock protein)
MCTALCTAQDAALAPLLEGVQMTEAQLQKAFAAQGLERWAKLLLLLPLLCHIVTHTATALLH